MLICAYTIADGLGGRAAGDPIAYAVWLFFLDAWPTIGVVLWLRRGRFLQASGRGIAQSLTGGLLSMLAYAIVIWAMVHAPVAVVAALRESSILFGALIGLFVLRERPGRVRMPPWSCLRQRLPCFVSLEPGTRPDFPTVAGYLPLVSSATCSCRTAEREVTMLNIDPCDLAPCEEFFGETPKGRTVRIFSAC